MPRPRRLDDTALRVEVLAACRELLAEGRYPSQHAINRQGVVAKSDRIIAARAEIVTSGGLDDLHDPRVPIMLRRASAVQRQSKIRKLDPPKPREDPADDEGPCWRERRAFWSTEAGKRTRALLRRQTDVVCDVLRPGADQPATGHESGILPVHGGGMHAPIRWCNPDVLPEV